MDLNQQLAQLQESLNGWQSLQQQLSGKAPAAQQSSIAVIEPAPATQQELLIKLYEEFVKTDEGKQLAANLARFARFAQSKVARQEV